jgi:hypothetical protein
VVFRLWFVVTPTLKGKKIRMFSAGVLMALLFYFSICSFEFVDVTFEVGILFISQMRRTL